MKRFAEKAAVALMLMATVVYIISLFLGWNTITPALFLAHLAYALFALAFIISKLETK